MVPSDRGRGLTWAASSTTATVTKRLLEASLVKLAEVDGGRNVIPLHVDSR
jgi:hypothetical protein